MPLAHFVDPFKQVDLIVNDDVSLVFYLNIFDLCFLQGDTNGHTAGSTGEMQVEEIESEDPDMREIEVEL